MSTLEQSNAIGAEIAAAAIAAGDLDDEEDEFDYNSAFPALGNGENRSAAPSAWAARPVGAVRPSNVVECFTIPIEEQRFSSLTEFTAGESKTTREVRDIQQQTNTTINLSVSKDKELSVIITGKRNQIHEAKKLLMNKLQTQASINLAIPIDHHGYLIGKDGSRLKEIQDRYAVSIRIPKHSENSEIIQITGTSDNIRACADAIQLISDEKARMDIVRLPILKAYHQLIAGPNNATTKQLMQETGVRIHMPPPKEDKDEIVVSGEKGSVAVAVQALNLIYEEKKRTCGELTANVPKSQHRFVIGHKGSHLLEIFEKTGVVVEVPPSETDSETLILRGAQPNLVSALTLVYEKANSVVLVFAPIKSWLHKHVIGKSGSNLKSIMADYNKVHIKFNEEKEGVEIEGPPEEVEIVKAALLAMAKELEATLQHVDIKVDPDFHRRIIGKRGATVDKIKGESGAQITIPSPDTHSDLIRVEGTPEAVAIAKAAIEAIATRLANHRETPMVVDRKFHRLLIGPKGATISSIQSKFNSVNIKMPSSNTDSEIVYLSGDKKDVDGAEAHIKKLLRQFEEENYQIEVPVFRKFHGNIIGRKGENIKKIMEETSTQITIPKGESDSDVITVVGRRQGCEKARDLLLGIQNELANVEIEEVDVDPRFQSSIIGPKGKVVNAIMQEFGVMIHFPQGSDRTTKPNTVVIRGPKAQVPKAKARVLELAKEAEKKNQKELVEVKAEFHRFIIGRGGAFLKKLESDTGCRLVFPTSKGSKDKDAKAEMSEDNIAIVGKKEDIAAAKKAVLERVEQIKNTVEESMTMDQAMCKEIIRSQFLKDLSDEFDGVQIHLPRESEGDKVTVKGGKDDVAAVIERLTKQVEEIQTRVTIEMQIPREHLPAVMGAGGKNVRQICSDFNVAIKFPERRNRGGKGGKKASSQSDETATENGAAATAAAVAATEEEGETEAAVPTATSSEPEMAKITIAGQPDKCEQAKAALQALVPISEVMDIPNDFHRLIIGTKGEAIRRLSDEAGVRIKFPTKQDESSDAVVIKGLPTNIAKARELLAERMKECEELRLKQFKTEVEIDPEHHSSLIGHRGANINELRKKHDVEIDMPRKDAAKANVIVITGYAKDGEACKQDMLEQVKELESHATFALDLDHRVRPRIIGQGGRGLRNLQDKFNVRITFPREKEEPVLIIGPGENVENCKEELLNMEEEFMEQVLEREEERQYMSESSKKSEKKQSEPKAAFKIKNAPWNHQDQSAFPTLGNGAAPAASSWGSGAWKR